MSKTLEAIKVAINKGYTADPACGIVMNPEGRPLKATPAAHGYPTICLQGWTVCLHQFIAFLVWGEEAFHRRVVIRHLDGNKLNNRASNLAIGTARDNAMDVAPSLRRCSALGRDQALGFKGCSARSKKGWASRRVLTPEIRNEIRTRFLRGEPGPVLARQFGVSKSTVSRIAA